MAILVVPKIIGGGVVKLERVQVICPACGQQVEAVAGMVRLKDTAQLLTTPILLILLEHRMVNNIFYWGFPTGSSFIGVTVLCYGSNAHSNAGKHNLSKLKTLTAPKAKAELLREGTHSHQFP